MSACSIRTSRCRGRDSWSVGVQRGIGTSMALEVRYVGTRGKDQWRTQGNGQLGEIDRINYNEVEHLRQRVHQRVQAGAGQPAGEHRGRAWRDVRLHRRGRHRAAAGRSSRTSTASTASTAGNAAPIRARTGPTDLPEFPGDRNPNPYGFASRRSLARPTTLGNNANGLMDNADASARTRRPRAFRRTTSSPTRTCSAAQYLVTNIGETKYNWLQLELRRRYCGGTPVPDELRLRPRPTSPTSRACAAISSGFATPARQATSRIVQGQRSSTTCRSVQGGAGPANANGLVRPHRWRAGRSGYQRRASERAPDRSRQHPNGRHARRRC